LGSISQRSGVARPHNHRSLRKQVIHNPDRRKDVGAFSCPLQTAESPPDCRLARGDGGGDLVRGDLVEPARLHERREGWDDDGRGFDDGRLLHPEAAGRFA